MAKKTNVSEFDKKLATMNEDWKANKDAPPGAPDGTYTMQMQGLQLREAESSGNLYINREHLIIEGEHEGTVVYDMLSLASDQGPYFVSRFIDKMGFEVPEKAVGIPEVLASIEADAPVYSATIKHNGDFVNVRIGEIISGADTEDKGADPGSVADQAANTTDTTIPIGTKVKFTDTDDGEIEGELVSNETDDDHRVKDANNQEWSVERHELQLVGGVEDDQDGDIPGTGEENVDDLIELIALAQACDCEDVNADDNLEDVVKKMDEGYTWQKADLDSNERLLLGRHGIKLV